MHEIGEVMKIKAALVLAGRASARVGLVSATRQDLFAVKVTIQPEGVETGWLPVLAAMAGNGWGICARPIPGSQVLVLFQEDDPSNGVVIGSLFSIPDQPPSTAMGDGEFWLKHQSGSILKFTNDGNVTLDANAKMILQASEFDFTGTVKVTGDINATGTVTGTTDVKTGTISLKSHVHPGVTSGPSLTGLPQ